LQRKNLSVPDEYAALRPDEVFSTESPTITPGENPLRFSGKVYVLSAKDTFSSAQMFLAVVKDNRLATIVGEETNEPACSFGELYLFNLPHSGLRTSLSVKYWIPPGGCKSGAPGVVPDILVERRVADYVSDKDAILEQALNLIKKK
jgi:C-terminal processing protease CtpA/Prc